MAPWAVIGVESAVAWPKADTEVVFRGQRLLLRPASEVHAASVVVKCPPPMTMEDGHLLIRHFLSTLSWVERAPIKEVGAIGGSGPFFVGRGPLGFAMVERFRQDFLPDPTDSRARLALALYREALSLETVAYKYLSFFKIINIRYSTGTAQKSWLAARLPLLRSAGAVRRVKELAATQTDVGSYMWESGRCAVAHAYNSPLVDPDNVEDSRRLASDLPVLEELVEYLIEFELGVKSRETFWNEHLYHLEGFREVLGPDLILRLKSKGEVPIADVPDLPHLSLGVRDKEQLTSFENMVPAVIGVEDGTIWISCIAPSGAVQVVLGLAVAGELLFFDPLTQVGCAPERTREVLQAGLDHLALIRDLLGNGQVTVSESTTGRLLGRTDAYVGTNIDLTGTLRSLERRREQLMRELASLGDAQGDSKTS